MKKKFMNICGILLCALSFTACEMDNYDEPDAMLEGKFVNKVTKQNLEAEQGQGNIKLRIKEISFAHGDETVVVTEQNLNVMQDGTFRNTKLFAGEYEMYPYESCCYEGKEIMQNVVLKGGKSTNITFEVTPYFEVEMGDPYQDAEGYVCVDIVFQNNPLPGENYTQAIAEKAVMRVSTTAKINADPRYSTGSEVDVKDKEGSVITLKSKKPVEFNQKLWVRAGVKPKNDTSHGIYDKFCYSSIKSFDAKGTK